MKKLVISGALVCAVACAVSMSGCVGFGHKKVKLTGEYQSNTYAVSDSVHKLEMKNMLFANGHSAKVSVSDGTDGVTVYAPSDIKDYGFRVTVADSKITIATDKRYAFSNDIEVAVSAKLNRATFVGNYDVSINAEGYANFQADFSGACDAELNNFSGQNLKINASGASNVSALNLKGVDFRLAASGNSGLDFSTLQFETVTMDVSGSSSIGIDAGVMNKLDSELSGASTLSYGGEIKISEFHVSGAATATLASNTVADRAKFFVSGASTLNASDFAVNAVTTDLSGASTAKVNAIVTLDVEASGASSVFYKGDPTVQSHLTGASKIKKL